MAKSKEADWIRILFGIFVILLIAWNFRAQIWAIIKAALIATFNSIVAALEAAVPPLIVFIIGLCVPGYLESEYGLGRDQVFIVGLVLIFAPEFLPVIWYLNSIAILIGAGMLVGVILESVSEAM